MMPTLILEIDRNAAVLTFPDNYLEDEYPVDMHNFKIRRLHKTEHI